jgi:hypothetical protein
MKPHDSKEDRVNRGNGNPEHIGCLSRHAIFCPITLCVWVTSTYGSNVINDLLTYEFGGQIDLVYATEGFRCTIELPANAETLV